MRGLNRAEGAALRAIASQFGYLSTRGPLVKDGAESGNAIEFLLAIISGEVAPVLLADEERRHAINVLSASGDPALESIARQLLRAAEREQEFGA